MLDIIFSILKKNSPCRSLQKIEARKFKLYGNSLEIGNIEFNNKSFFNDFKLEKKNKIFFSDIIKIKKKNYFIFDLEKKNNLKKKFDNIIIFNVLEHVYEIDNAFVELKKLLKPKGKIYISTPFLYRYHSAPKDYYRFTLDFYEKIAKKQKIKIIYKKSLGTGPFFSCYSVIHNILNFLFPLNILVATVLILFDKIINIFSKSLKYTYPICNFLILRKDN